MKRTEIIKELVNLYGYGLPAAIANYNCLSDSGAHEVTRQELDSFIEENY